MTPNKTDCIPEQFKVKQAKSYPVVVNILTTTYQSIEDNQVSEVTYNSELSRVYINKQNYFTDIPPHIWEFKIGGYQVLDK